MWTSVHPLWYTVGQIEQNGPKGPGKKDIMQYVGTRNSNIKVSSAQAILQGICPDGGLFIPAHTPQLTVSLAELCAMSYPDLAFTVLSAFLTDFTPAELRYCVDSAYDDKFDTPLIAPLVKAGDEYFLELFHGRTLAFKDMALSIHPYLMSTAAKKEGLSEEIVILVATSGDTGKAALEGFADVPGTRIMVFFPEDGVSPVQKLQMQTQEGQNVYVAGIKGNFDDAQTAVKAVFTDEALKAKMKERGYVFSSANSINIGRLTPQVAYYFYAYAQLVRQGAIALGDKVNFTVPTGNFGDILAGYYAQQMGLPVGKLICASNKNKVLYDYFKTGVYDKNREFFVTTSPSMDILISSNLERLLCHEFGPAETARLMNDLKTTGVFRTEPLQEMVGEYADEAECAAAIRSLYQSAGYVMDPHTAVAYAAYQKYRQQTGDNTVNVVVSTASPFKFTKDVLCAIDPAYEGKGFFELVPELVRLSKTPEPAPIRGLAQRERRHQEVIPRDGIPAYVQNKLL